jgi:hypothetical protein
MAVDDYVYFSRGLRNGLRWGYEMQRDAPAHMTVKRIAVKVGYDPRIVGSMCQVRGYATVPVLVSRAVYCRLMEVLLDV